MGTIIWAVTLLAVLASVLGPAALLVGLAASVAAGVILYATHK